MRRALALIAPLCLFARPAAATSELDYVEHIFGVTNVNAVGGHGALTIAESADGDLTVLSWPSPGYDDQLAYLTSNDIDARALPHFGAPDGMGSYLGLVIDTGAGARVTWLRDATTWTAAQTYSQPDSVVPVTTFTSASLGLTVTLTDVVSPDVDVLTREVHVVRASGSPVVSASLAVYENLSPSLSRVPEVPVADWALDAHNDFFAVWDEASHGILHVHPGDRETFLTLVDLISLTADVDFGPVEDLMKQSPPAPAAIAAFVDGIDAAYTPGVAAIVTTEPAPASHQVGADATPMCALVDHMVDNVIALPTIYPSVNVPLTPDSAEILRCTDQLPRFATMHAWTWQPEDALADLADATLSGSPVAAAQTNGALIAPIAFAPDGTADASMMIAFGATRAAARTALAAAQAQPFAARLSAAEAASHAALAGAPMPDPALGPRVVPVAQRALANLYVARDRASGAFLAAVTRQPPYALDWPRDGAFLSLAADLAGRTDWVTQRDEWYVTTQRKKPVAGMPALQPTTPVDPTTGQMTFPADAWEMNYYVDGEAGGPIRFEIDNTALHIWATAVHAAALTDADRAAFLAAVWPTDRAALDLLVRWKEPDTDLPAAANEDDNLALTSTLHGAVAVYTGLVAGARLAHAMNDDDRARAYLDRANALRTAIDAAYYDPMTMLFRAARGLPGGPHDSIAGWDTGWLVWPARFFAPDDPRLELQLSSDMDGILAILRGQTQPGGTYTAKNVLAAALYGAPGGARDKAATAVTLLSQIATPGTDSFGEVYMPSTSSGSLTWSNRTATPHVWEGALFYLSAMALSHPERFNAEETALPLPPPAGCGCSSSSPPSTALPALLVLAFTLRRRRIAVVVVSLAACGGGGHSSVDATPAVPDAMATPDATSTVPSDPIAYTKDAPFQVGADWVYVPDAYDGSHHTPIELLVWLHGCGGYSSGDIWMVSPGGAQRWISLAVGGEEGTCWDVDNDPARVLASIDALETHFNIARERVVIGGYSSGGDLTYRTAFYHAERFAGALVENSSPFRDTGSSMASSLAAASWKLNVVHLAHLQDNTYPIDGVRAETDAMTAAGFPMRRIEVDGGHWDDANAIENGHPVAGTAADLQTYLLPELDAGWTAP